MSHAVGFADLYQSSRESVWYASECSHPSENSVVRVERGKINCLQRFGQKVLKEDLVVLGRIILK